MEKVNTEYGVVTRKKITRNFQNLHQRDPFVALAQIKWPGVTNVYELHKNMAVASGVCTEEQYIKIYEDKLHIEVEKTPEQKIKEYIAKGFKQNKTEEQIIVELRKVEFPEDLIVANFKSLQKADSQSNTGSTPVVAVAHTTTTKTPGADYIASVIASGKTRQEAHDLLKGANWSEKALAVEFPELYKAEVTTLPPPPCPQ